MAALPITALATLFGAVTVAVPLVVAYRFRHRPVVALLAIGERRLAFHRDALAGLDHAIAVAGSTAEAARLEPARAAHVRALQQLSAGEWAGHR